MSEIQASTPNGFAQALWQSAGCEDKGLVVETVLGPVPASKLGSTHMHEHVLLDYTPHRRQSQGIGDAAELARWSERITLSNRYKARRNPHAYREAVRMSDVAEAVAATIEFERAGGGCLVDLTPPSLGQDPDGLRNVAYATNVKIVMGTGYYTHAYHGQHEEDAGVDVLRNGLVTTIERGVGESGVRPGIIGEVGLSYPLLPCEAKVLEACVGAQIHTGLALSIHPGRDARAPFEIVEHLHSYGGDLSRTIIGHLDRTLFRIDDFVRLADTGCVLELDQFGMETWFAELSQIDLPSNAERIRIVEALCSRGYTEQIVIGQDIDNNMRRSAYGGEGYQHILNDVAPLMCERGITLSDVSRILITNPRRILGRPAARASS